MAEERGSVVIIGGSTGIGRAIAQRYADAGREVVVTSRDPERAASVATEIGGRTRGIALDLAQPRDIAGALADVGPVEYLVLGAVDRDDNAVRDYNIDGAINLATLKLVGYTEVVHALVPRLDDNASIVVFGGLAKERPYPGSTTVTTVNGAVSSMVRTLAVELAPVRVNAIHPAVVGDTAYWENKPPEVLDALRSRTPLGRLVETEDVVHATAFLLENRAVNGINLDVDGGWLLT